MQPKVVGVRIVDAATAGAVVIELSMRGVNRFWPEFLHSCWSESGKTIRAKRRAVRKDIDGGIRFIEGERKLCRSRFRC